MIQTINANNLIILCILAMGAIIVLAFLLHSAHMKKAEMQATLIEESKGLAQLSMQLFMKVENMEKSADNYSKEMKEGFTDMKTMLREYMDNLRFDIRDINSKIK